MKMVCFCKKSCKNALLLEVREDFESDYVDGMIVGCAYL